MVVSPRRATADFMVRSLSTETAATLAELPDGGRILEVKLDHSSPVVGKRVKDIQLPRSSLFVAIQHKFKAGVPTAEDTLVAGDRVLVLVDQSEKKALLSKLV